ncbi:MAG TPA: hypothetical protein DCZ94_16485 [Lentisphaeria bacterium]|nr:MAG: hypothetical protein A2X48_01850 [Lentisphaerae bacterium GWF2_49_21]HBC88546.1 hypothetical protein [Lentisphaeria bacterium]
MASIQIALSVAAILGGIMSSASAITIDFEKGKDDSFKILNENYASITKENPLSGTASLLLDTRSSSSEWNACFATSEGVLKPDTDYVISLTVKILEAKDDSFVHVIVRPLDVIDGTMDVERANFVDVGSVKKMKMKFRTKKDKMTYALQIHPKNKVLALVDDIVITKGTGESYVEVAPDAKPFTKPLTVATGAAEFTVDMPKPAEKTVSVAEFGAKPENPDNCKEFNDAIRHCKENSIGKLVVPNGVYRFTSNNPVKFSGLKDFEFDAQGSEFIWLKERGGLIEIAGCERVLFRNFFVDWDWEKDPVGSVVKITGIDTDGSFIEAKFLDFQRFPKRDMRIGIIEGLDPVTMSVGYENSINIGFEFFKGRADTPPAKYEWLSDNSFRLYAVDANKKSIFAKSIRPGMLFRIRHYVYDMVGISMSDNKHLTLSNITIYSCPSHAFVSAGEQHHWQFLNTHIKLRPGTKRPLTCSADHHHIARSQGFFKMDGCDFGFGGDDCLNVHDTTGFASRSGEKILTTKNMDVSYYKAGDLVELRNDDYSPTGYTSKLVKKGGDGKGRKDVYELTFEDPIPEQKGTGFILFNKRFGSRNIIIRNSYFHDNKARGLLLLTNDVTVENNRFFHNEMGAIKIETGYTFNVWSEGYGASNIVIRNNVFENVNPIGAYRNEKQPVIYMSVYLKSDPSVEKTLYPILNNILVEKNSFVNNPGVIAYICSAGNVVIRDNRIENNKTRIENQLFRGSIGAAYASDVKIVNNTWIRSQYNAKPGVFADIETTKDILFEGNTVQDK